MSTAVHTENPVIGRDLAACFVSDPARSIAFYRDVLGMIPTSIDDRGRDAEFTLRDGSTFAVWSGSLFGKTSGACPMLAVSDITSTVAVYRERGLVLSGEDADGNTLIIHQRKETHD